MNVQSVSSWFKPKLEVVPDARMGFRLVNTTGDSLDDDYSAIIPKQAAQLYENEKGEVCIKVTHHDQDQLIPKEYFQETPGENGVFYLPTFQDNPKNAVISGALRGYAALGVFGVASGAAGGLATLVPSDSRLVKLGAAALAGAALSTGAQALFQGNTALPLAAVVGGISGVGAALAGSGEARVRDSLYGGVAMGMAFTLTTGAPLMGIITGGTAAGLACSANSKVGQVITGGTVGAALGAAQAVLSHSNVGMAAGIGAAMGAVGPLIGPPLMQLSRNLAQFGGDKIRDLARGRSDKELIALSAIPGALSWGLMGGAAALVDPSLAVPGMVIGGVFGAAQGMYMAHKRIKALTDAEAQAEAAARPAAPAPQEKSPDPKAA